MSKVVFSSNLANGETADATEVMTLLDDLKTGANAIDNDNISSEGISESKITFTSAAGHDHDGTAGSGGALAALAVEGGNQGTLKVRAETETSLTAATWSGNMNPSGTDQVDTVLAVTPMWTSAAAGAGESCHTNLAGTLPTTADHDAIYSSRYYGADNGTVAYYVVVDDSVTPNEVYVYNDTGTTMTRLIVMILGV